MVRITGLTKSYKGFPVLKGLNMHIQQGDVYGFIGKNGCGKTTAMNIICNIIPKDSGEIVLADGKPFSIGYLPESPALFGYMNGYEYLAYIGACTEYQGDLNQRITEVLKLVNMTEGGKRRIKGYSRGMNQRLGIAATIFNHPDLIILDEPTSALDPEGRAEVIQIIQSLTGLGSTILLCTHILSDIERVANCVGVLANGVMVDEGPITEVIKRHAHKNGVILKLSRQNPDAIQRLREIPEVLNSEIDSRTGTLSLYTENEEKLSIDIIRILAELQIGIESMEVTRPTLEEVYLKLVAPTRKGGAIHANQSRV